MNHIGQRVEADLVVSISEFKRNPSSVMKAAEDQAVAVLNHNKIVGYVISPEVWEHVQEVFDDLKLVEIAESRRGEPSIEVSIDDLSSDI